MTINRRRILLIKSVAVQSQTTAIDNQETSPIKEVRMRSWRMKSATIQGIIYPEDI